MIYTMINFFRKEKAATEETELEMLERRNAFLREEEQKLTDRLTQMKQEASNSNVFVCGQTQVVLGIDVDSHIVVSVGSDYLVNIWSTVTKVGRF